jgi:hypothetical protein
MKAFTPFPDYCGLFQGSDLELLNGPLKFQQHASERDLLLNPACGGSEDKIQFREN